MKEADGLGVNGTPTLFINGQKIDGAVPIAEVRAALDAALKDAGRACAAALAVGSGASIQVDAAQEVARQLPQSGLLCAVAVRNGEILLKKTSFLAQFAAAFSAALLLAALAGL